MTQAMKMSALASFGLPLMRDDDPAVDRFAAVAAIQNFWRAALHSGALSARTYR